MPETLSHKLYGDGLHDDLPAIQEMLDSGMKCVSLPCPDVNYLISGPVKVHSNQELKLERNARIVLKDWSDSLMLKIGSKDEFCENVTIKVPTHGIFQVP